MTARPSGSVRQHAMEPELASPFPAENGDAARGDADMIVDPPKLERKLSDSLNKSEWSPLDNALQSVIKIFCVSATPNFYVPWQIHPQRSSSSSGFVIEGKRIICNAHGITNHVYIRVRKHGDATKYRAKLLATGHDCDLALLTVDDENFWRGLKPLHFGNIPALQASVIVIGYPKGGDCISVTKGVVSRVVIATYSHSNQVLLCVQIDAAINSGNSGGPALQGDKVVGVAFQGMNKAQNIGYIIPATVVKQFINDVDRNGNFSGIPCVGLKTQILENESLRKSLKIPNDNEGILVIAMEPLAPCAKVLKVNDVIRKIDGVPVAGDGTIFFRRGERLSHVHLITSKSRGDSVRFEIMREGKTMEMEVQLGDPEKLALVPVNLYDALPSYYVYAGLVFTVLSRPYLRAWGSSWSKKAPSPLTEKAFYGVKEKVIEGQEIVILSQVLAAPVNTSYERVCYLTVLSVNETKVHNLRHMVELVEKAEEEGQQFIKFKEDSAKILKQNQITHSKSADLRNGETLEAVSPKQQRKRKGKKGEEERSSKDSKVQDP